MKSHKKELKSSFALGLLEHLRQYTHWYLLLVLMLLAILIYYWFEWRTFTNFVVAIDHSSQFMADFVAAYYPMGRQISGVETLATKKFSP